VRLSSYFLVMGAAGAGAGRARRWKPPAPEPLAPVNPTFHEFASDWFDAKRPELRSTSAADYAWQLTHHLLPLFHRHRLSAITVAEVDRYRQAKVRDGRLSATSINKTITRLGQILDVAEERELIARNPVRVNPRNRRLKATRAARSYLNRAEQIVALLDAAAELDREARADRSGVGRRAMLATMTFAGLRVGEVCGLRWRDVDLAAGRLRVRESKTDAGVRYVRLLPVLLDDLATHKATTWHTAPADRVFATREGRPRNKDNVRERALRPAVKRADERLAKAELAPLPDGLTPHSLRRTFASLLVAIGDDPRQVMGQLGHTDPALTLRLYAQEMDRDDGERDRLRALVQGGSHARTPAAT
jgi:integrase